MKHKLLIAVLITMSTVGYSQDYMDDIALKACDCLNSVSDTLAHERFNLELYNCLIDAAKPHKKKLKKEYKIDIDRIDTFPEELARLIGQKMVSVCPDALLRTANRFKKNSENKSSESIVTGQIIEINDNKFVEFSVKDESGKISKFYWFTFIESDIELSNNYKTLLDKLVRITYSTQDFFDSRIAEYRAFYIIQKLEILEE